MLNPDNDQRLNRKVSAADAYANSDQWAARVTGYWGITRDLEWQGGFEHCTNKGAGDSGLKDCKMGSVAAYACGPEGQWQAIINVPGKIDMTIDTKPENIGDSNIHGLELEFKLLPWTGGNLSGFLAVLDTKVKSYETYSDEWMCGYRA